MRCQDCGQQFTSWEACKNHLLKHLEEEVKLERERKKRPVVSTVSEDSGPQLEKKMKMDVKEEEIIGPGLEMDFKEEEIFDPQLEMDFKEEEISGLRLETKVWMDSKEEETSGPQLEKKTSMDVKKEEIKLNSVDHEPLSESSGQIKPYEIFIVHHPAVQSEEGNSMSSLAKKVYVCSICGKMYFSDASFRKHQMTHVDHKKNWEFSCKECGKSFARSAGLAVHMRYHRQANLDELHSFHCEQCNKDFRTTDTYMAHQKMHKRKPFWCHKCRKGFERRETLDKHLLGHDAGKYRCLICQKAFQVVSELRHHLDIHRASKPHRCGVCQRTFSHLDNLIIHSKKHLEMSKHGKKEARIAKGQIMKKRVLGGSNVTTCQVASKLRHHVDVHRAPKPHRCNVCQRTFIHLGNLIIHSKKHLKMSKDGKKEARFAKGQIMKKRVVGGSDVMTERVQDVESDEDSTSSESSDSSASTGSPLCWLADESDSSDSSSDSSARVHEGKPANGKEESDDSESVVGHDVLDPVSIATDFSINAREARERTSKAPRYDTLQLPIAHKRTT
ncbi:hypothetical protein MHYP_G00031540 [Metynnis hypsauchen]